MEIKITSNTKNELLSRSEIAFTATYDGATPSRMDLIAKIAALQNAPVETVVLSPLESRFGQRAINGIARVYASVEALKATENAYIVARGQPKPKAEE